MKRKPGQTFSPMVSSGRLQYNGQIAVGFRNVILRAAARIACGSFQQVYIAALEFIRVFKDFGVSCSELFVFAFVMLTKQFYLLR